MIAPRNLLRAPCPEAFEALWNGDDIRALALAHNVDQPGYAALRALASFRLHRYDRSLAEHARRHLSKYDPHEAAWLATIACEVLAVAGELLRARETLAPACALARRNGDPSLIALCRLAESSVLLRARDLEQSHDVLSEAARLVSDDGPIAAKAHHVDVFALRPRIGSLQARLDIARGDVRAAERTLLRAASSAADPRNPDRALEAQILATLATFAARASLPAATRHLRERVASFAWSPNTDGVRTTLRRCLHASARLFGDGDGLRTLGGRTAPTLPLRLAECVEAITFDRWNEPRAFIEESRFCVGLALDVDWTVMPAEHLLDLVTLAAVVAPFDLAFAQHARRIYEVRRANHASYACGVRVANVAAMLALADGCIAKAAGNLRDAVERLAAVADLDTSRDALFASIAGIERFTITRLESDLRPALAFVRAFPGAPFALRLWDALAGLDAAPSAFPYLGMYGGDAPPGAVRAAAQR